MSRIAAPLEIRVTDKGRTLVLTYEAEGEMALSAEYLRVESPSAEVQGHTAKDKRIIAGKKDVTITGAHPVGNYAIKLTFSDGHDTGIYAWDTFLDMARRHDEIWSTYLANLATRGLTR